MTAHRDSTAPDAHKADDLPSLSVRRPVLVTVMSLLIVIAGLAAIPAVEVRELPDVDRPVVTVRAFWDGAAPETMDAEVTSVIEGAVARVAGVDSIEAASEENNARMRARFKPTVDLDTAANDVREAVASIERDLPEGVEDLTVVKADADADPIIRLAVAGEGISIEELTRIAEDEIAAALAAIPGVATVSLFGNQRQILRIVVDPLRLASLGLSIRDVAETVETTDLDVPAGSFKSDDQMLIVRANASVIAPSEIERLEIAEDVRLGDVAQAFYGPEDAESYVRLNGRQVVGLGIVRRAQSNTIEISKGVDAAIERMNRRSDTVEIIKMSDDARFIQGAVNEVVTSLLMAVGVVVAVIFVFLGSLRATLVPAVSIPIALIGAVAAIWLLGFSVNILTLLALVLATGLIVDDAIVVLENVQRHRAMGFKPLAAAVLGTRQVFFAVLATTATLIAVFLPIAFLPSEAGRMFAEFGFVLAIAVAISSFVALSLCPMLLSRLPGARTLGESDTDDPPGALARLGDALAALYARILDAVLHARLLVLGLAAAGAAASWFAFQALDEELLPKEDRGLIMVSMQGPDGVGLDYMDRQAELAEAILEPYREAGLIRTVMTIVGRWDLNRVFIIAPLADWSDRTMSQQDLMNELRGPLSDIPGATARLRSSNSLSIRGGGGGFEMAITGPTHPEIAGAADIFMEAIRGRIPQLSDLRLSYQPTQPQLSIDVDRRRAEDLGVDVDDIEMTLRSMVDGFEVAELNVADRSVPVVLESAAGAIDDPGDLDNLFVPARGGQLVPLSSFISLKEEGVAAELDRAGQKRAIEIDADVAPGYAMGQAIRDLEALGDEVIPEGFGLLFLGEAASLDENTRQIAITFAIAVLVVFLVLAAQFESLLSAAVIVLTVPFGLAAAVFALTVSGTSINIYSQIGLVMLVGLMAKNGILVVEFADQLRDRGYGVMEAVRESAIVRLRPVMMTVLSTVLSAVPLVIGAGAGAEARNAIGWVVFGGLGMATVFTLFLIPVFYSLLAPLTKPRAHRGVRLDRELREAVADSATPAE
jgi:HAE1 family hydrophobic/amphiphilic exporter-1